MVRWSAPAKTDLQNIHDYIAQDSRHYAKKVTDEILERSITLDDFPLKGRIVPEIEDPNVREVFLYSYRLIYEIRAKTIFVLAVAHGKRDLTSLDIEQRTV